MRHRKIRVLQVSAAAMALLFSVQVMAQGDLDPLPPPDPEVYLDRSGFNEMIVNQAVFGMQVGSALTTALFEDDLRQSSGILLGLGAGIALPILLTKGKPVPSADVVYINQLQRFGLINGLLLHGLISPSMSDNLFDPRTNSWRISQGLMAAGSLLGLGAAILTKDALDLMPGQASALGSGYFFGMYTAAMLLFILDREGDERVLFGTLLGLSNLGLGASFLLRDHFAVDRSRIIWTTIGAGVGAAVGAGLGWLFAGEYGPIEVTMTTSLVGFWAGAAVTYFFLLPPDGFRSRTETPLASLVGIDENGRLGLGIPTPSPVVLSPRNAGESPVVGATLNLLEWRSR